jgi:hypothetical protein
MVQFITFRKNVWFDRVSLLKETSAGKATYLAAIAECHWKDEFTHEQPRDNARCITFEKLGVASAANLYDLVERRRSKKGKVSVAFIPESQKDTHWITGQQLKDVCTALEVEASAQKMPPKNEETFDNLVATIKQDMKATHRTDNALTNREYSYIASNTSLWSAPAAELDHGLYEQRRESLEPLLDILGIKDLSEDAIQAVIKQRNNMAHGGMATRTNTTSEEIIALMGVVYSSILSRCGCSDGVISKLFEWGLLTA